MATMADFIAGLPKAELHVHIEGTFEPALMFDIAGRHGISLPYASVEDLAAAYRFRNLQEFLDLYYQGMKVLIDAQDFYDLTWAYLQRARAQNVLHAEIFFDPQAHTDRGIAFDTVLDGIGRALDHGRKTLGITSRLILCFLRDKSVASAEATLDQALDHRDRIIGVGLDSAELGHPPVKFRDVFARARTAGLRAVAHAGEEGPAHYVHQALDELRVERIDHGNRALGDDALVDRLARDRIALTMCPLSNLRLQVLTDLRRHPLRPLMERGVPVTINSDDPAYFGGYVNENYAALQAALSLSRAELAAIARTSFTASFIDPADKDAYVAKVDAYAAMA
jgi:adenosine deaminase